MKRLQYAAIILLIGAALTLLVLIRAAYCEMQDDGYRPEVNTAGLLCYPVHIAAEQEPSEPEYELYYTPEDAEIIAKTVWGEARGCTREGQAKVVWVILNRVEDSRFPDTIRGVVTQPCQFYGYSPNHPVTPEILAVVNDVLNRWNSERNGIAVTRELSREYVFFTGDGRVNHFREVFE